MSRICSTLRSAPASPGTFFFSAMCLLPLLRGVARAARAGGAATRAGFLRRLLLDRAGMVESCVGPYLGPVCRLYRERELSGERPSRRRLARFACLFRSSFRLRLLQPVAVLIHRRQAPAV